MEIVNRVLNRECKQDLSPDGSVHKIEILSMKINKFSELSEKRSSESVFKLDTIKLSRYINIK